MAARHPYHKGDLVLVQFPFSSAAGHKDRPAVVISSDLYHDQWDELLVVALTSRTPKLARPTDYLLLDWISAGLLQPSWFRSHLATVDRRIIIRKLGVLSARDLAAVENCLRLAQAL
jgi:mRNA interferase MazF